MSEVGSGVVMSRQGTHSFSEAGEYTVQLEIVDDLGITDSITATIEVEKADVSTTSVVKPEYCTNIHTELLTRYGGCDSQKISLQNHPRRRWSLTRYTVCPYCALTIAAALSVEFNLNSLWVVLPISKYGPLNRNEIVFFTTASAMAAADPYFGMISPCSSTDRCRT